MSCGQHPLGMDQSSTTGETSLELEVCLPWPGALHSLEPPDDPVGGIAHVVWLDVVDAALIGEGEGGSTAKEKQETNVS